MPNVTVQSNTIVWKIIRGTSAILNLTNPAGWDQYDEILMHIKKTRELDESPLIRLMPDDGLLVNAQLLTISISNAQSKKLKAGNLYADIKLKLAGKVLDPIPFLIQISNSVTNMS